MRPKAEICQRLGAGELVSNLDSAEKLIRGRHATLTAHEPRRASLVGISGIDASGKGFVTARPAELLARSGLRVANLNVDGWLNLPSVRFGGPDPGRRFYERALRLGEMFARLVLPLRERRSVELEMDYTEETADAYRQHTYQFCDVDVIPLEGIFLFKRAYRDHFDLRFWVDCSFKTALRRAISRGQEGLAAAETLRAYETIYFPAQRIHFAQDDPSRTADAKLPNDAILPCGCSNGRIDPP